MLKGVSKKRGLFLFLDTPSVFISGIWQNAANSLRYFIPDFVNASPKSIIAG